jgi:UDP:flavonoid glycosyltransferase YjiC (YdhE family)
LAEALPGNIHVADYLPGMKAAARADLVVCNGGSPTTQQALAAGVPVLGLPSNLDQHLNMRALERSGVGLLVRSEQASVARIKTAVVELLRMSVYKETAQKYAVLTAGVNTGERFRGLVEGVLAGT